MIKNSSQLSEKEIQKVIEENFDEIAPFYYKLLSEWTNSSYETFQDIDKYLIILYLINKAIVLLLFFGLGVVGYFFSI